jgi:diguanylate cyclase (GGDEF)-like protein
MWPVERGARLGRRAERGRSDGSRPGRTKDPMNRSREVLGEDAFRRLLAVEAERASRYRNFFSICLVKPDTDAADADHEIQHAIASKIAESLRSTDIVGQLRDLTAFLLLHTTSADAVRVAERIRALIEKVAFPGPPGRSPSRITLSVGEVSFPRDGATDRALLSRAEATLLEAARQGGNRVVSAEDPVE